MHETIKPMTRVVLAVTLAVSLATSGLLAARSLAGPSASNATVSLRKTGLGPILVNSSGRTLYLFAKDKNGKSTCTGSCATFWPPLIARGTPTAGPGVRASLLGTTRRGNGSLQVTYNRHPLYTYSLDKRAGQTKGQGSSAFGAKWWAVSARGAAVVKPATTTPATTTTGTTGTSPTTTSTNSCDYPPCP